MNTIEIRALIARDELWRFYKSKDWLRLKEMVLRENHHECAECKKRGIITRYDIGRDGEKRLLSTVHHVMHVRDHPELAMSRMYRDEKTGELKVNLIPVCKRCHNKLHPEKLEHKSCEEKFTTIERW